MTRIQNEFTYNTFPHNNYKQTYVSNDARQMWKPSVRFVIAVEGKLTGLMVDYARICWLADGAISLLDLAALSCEGDAYFNDKQGK